MSDLCSTTTSRCRLLRCAVIATGLATAWVAGAAASGADDWEAIREYLDPDATWHGESGDGVEPADAQLDFLEQFAAGTGDPVRRAAAHYYLALTLVRRADAFSTSPEDRETLRLRAYSAAHGLSAGVEDATFDRLDHRGGTEAATFAEAEADIVRRIQHAAVGGRLGSAAGRPRDGSEAGFETFAGKMVLMGFWNTRCEPCAAELPRLRAIADELPGNRFAVLSISSDEAAGVVAEYQRREPMPWGELACRADGDMVRTWDVRSYPTYVFVDARGAVLARATSLSEPFLALIRETVDGAGDWTVVEDFIDRRAAWDAKDYEVRFVAESAQEKSRLEAERGSYPDIRAAVTVAENIIHMPGHPRIGAAAKFLVDRLSGDIEFDAMARIGALVGADWQVVEAAVDGLKVWRERQQAIEASDRPEAEKVYLRAKDEHRGLLRGVAAAVEILEDADNPRRQDAARFLVENGELTKISKYVLIGARALLADSPQYDRWSQAVDTVGKGHYREIEPVIEFLEDIVASIGDQAVRATARYHLAQVLMREADEFDTPPARREAVRQRALAAATRLSEGVADRVWADTEDTFAKREEELLGRIKHTSVGGTLPAVVGTRLDGTQESLAAFAGKTLLIDFWATWCGPCIQGIPTVRQLAEELPADRFAVLSISVDDDVETVIDFQREEPMPWANWRVDLRGEVTRAWDVRGYPTYLLVDGRGGILARTPALHDDFLALIREAAGAGQQAEPAPTTGAADG